MQNIIFAKLVGFMKKPIIKWISALAFAVGATAAGMQTAEFKEVACGAPVVTDK